MQTTVVVTRNVPDRFRGFLASCMLEVAPGVYLMPRMRKSVRERVWGVLVEWADLLPPGEGGVLLMWPDKTEPSGLALRFLGWPRKEFVDVQGMWLVRRAVPKAHELEGVEWYLEDEEE